METIVTPSASSPSADFVSRAMLERLISFDTTSAKSNLQAIAFIAEYLRDLGAEIELTYDDDGGKANLFATLGPADVAGILVSGHTDVVPVEGQDWHTDPFSLTESQGLLFGRGTSDMKGFLACCLALAPEFVRRGLVMPLHFACSYDEEVGCIGVRRLIEKLAARPVLPRLCIVGEPTEMKVIIAHKGKRSFRCHIRGLECHSSLVHEGVNAVEAAAEIIAFMKRMQRDLAKHGPHDFAFSPPSSTIHTGVIQGGTALNIIPRQCWFEFEIRNLPTEDTAPLLDKIKTFAETVILPEMVAIDPQCGIDWEEINDTSGLDMQDDHEATRLVSGLAGCNASGKVSFGTEAGLFQQAGIPTLVCGPGSIEQAHKPNEFIAMDQLAQCETFLRRLMDKMCRPE